MDQKILVVDDDTHIVRLCQVNLERAGYQVFMAYNGEEALEKLLVDKPDLVLLDLAMPNMAGGEVLEKIRNDPQTTDLPVIILTAKPLRILPNNSPLRGEIYLEKPFNPIDLLGLVKRLTATPPQCSNLIAAET